MFSEVAAPEKQCQRRYSGLTLSRGNCVGKAAVDSDFYSVILPFERQILKINGHSVVLPFILIIGLPSMSRGQAEHILSTKNCLPQDAFRNCCCHSPQHNG